MLSNDNNTDGSYEWNRAICFACIILSQLKGMIIMGEISNIQTSWWTHPVMTLCSIQNPFQNHSTNDSDMEDTYKKNSGIIFAYFIFQLQDITNNEKHCFRPKQFTHKVMPLREHNIFSLKIILSNERAWKAHFK